MPASYGEDKKDALCEAYRQLGSVPKAADQLGVSTTWGYRTLKERGVYERARPQYPDEMGERACELYVEEEFTLVEVCEQLGWEYGREPSHSYVVDQMDKRGLDRRDGGYARHGRRVLRYNGRRLVLCGKHGPEEVRRVLDDYVAGMPPREIEEEHGVPVPTTQSLTQRAGVRRDRAEARANHLVREGRISPVAGARIAERLYVEDEQSLSQIAEHLDCQTATVIDYLDKRGVERRSRSEGLLARHYGSVEAYARFCRRVARLYHGEDETKRAICEELGVSYPTVNRALESEHNPYGEDPAGEWGWVYASDGETHSRSGGLSSRSVPSRR